MPKLAFPVLANGLLVDVLIGLDGATTVAQFLAGQQITAPIRGRGEIDTGSNVSAVSAAILQRLGVPIQFQTTTQTVAGHLPVKVFEVSLGIRDFRDPTGPELVESTLSVELREDLGENRPLDPSEFAIHLDQVRDGRAHRDYTDPQRFFDRT